MGKRFFLLNKVLDRWPAISITGIIAAIIYCFFTLLSFLFFPGPFNPVNNNLSELGDFNDNPKGAVFYNLGMVITGLLAFFFYIELYRWFSKKKRSTQLCSQ